jgi:hypothetical protein
MTNVKEDKNAEIHARWLSVNGSLSNTGTYWLQDNNAFCYAHANAYSYAYACCHTYTCRYTYAHAYSLTYPHTCRDPDTSSGQRGDLWLRFCAVNVNCVGGDYSHLDQQRFSFPYCNQQ